MSSSIGFEGTGEVIVSIFMKPYEDVKLERIFFKCDPGSQRTLVSTDSLADLGYSKKAIDEMKEFRDVEGKKDSRFNNDRYKKIQEMVKLTSAFGEDKYESVIEFPVLSLFEVDFRNARLVVASGDKAKNLLGLDLLNYFNYTFSNDKWKFYASVTKPKFLIQNWGDSFAVESLGTNIIEPMNLF
jgi:hypothetical protein